MFKDGVVTVNWPNCKFDGKEVLQSGQLALHPGCSVVSGDSGIGKTTMLRAIAQNNSKIRSVLVFQEPTLLPWLTLEENLALVSKEHEVAIKWLDSFGLYNCLGLRPGQMSLGMQRRAAIVRGLIAKPDVLLLDEPSASLDQLNIDRLLDCLVEIIHSRSIPILLVSHQIDHFERLKAKQFYLGGSPAFISEV